MTLENKDRDRQKKLREFYETTGDKAAVWINDTTGQIVDMLPAESPIRELQPVAPRFPISASQQREIEQRPRFIDLVGRAPSQQHAVTAGIRMNPTQLLPELRRTLLLGKRGGP